MEWNIERRFSCLTGHSRDCPVVKSYEIEDLKAYAIRIAIAIAVVLVVVLVAKFRKMQRREVQRASGLAQLEKEEYFDKRDRRKIRKKWRYCRLVRWKDAVHIWIRPGLSLGDVELQMPRIYPRNIVLSVVQDAGVWRWVGSDFKAIFPAKSKLLPPADLKHPPRAVVIGRDEILGKPAVVSFNEHGLILVGGVNGQGKTSLLQTFTEAKNQTLTEIFSFSGADFPKISVKELCKKLENWKAQIECFDFAKTGRKPVNVLICDEFLRYEHEDKANRENLEKLVGFIAGEGRKYGYCLVLASQVWSNLPPSFARAGARIAFRLANAEQGQAFCQDRRANLLEKGHVIAVGFDFTLAHTFYRETEKTGASTS